MTPAEMRDLAAHYAMKTLPVPACSAAGAVLANAARLAFPNTHRHIKTLFAALRPGWAADPIEMERAARRCWTATGRTYAEVSVAWRMLRGGRAVFDHVERVDEAMASGRPVILLFVHTGNWEMSGMQFALRYPGRILAVYAPPTNAAHARIAMSVRRALPADFAAMSPRLWRQALRHLDRPGGVLWIAADEFTEGVVKAPFFGRPPSLDGNIGKVARLASRTGAIVVPFYSERHPGPRFTTHVLEPIRFDRADPSEGDLQKRVRQLESMLAPHVIRLIDQWYMALYYHDHASLAA